MKRLLPLFALILLLLLPASALAATNFYVSVLPTADTENIPADAVEWYRAEDGKYYLLLPGSVSLDDARVWVTGYNKVKINGETYVNGDPISGLVSGEAIKLTLGSKSYNVHVRQGSAIPAMFIATKSGKMTEVDRSKNYRETGSLIMTFGDGAINYNGALEYIKLRGNTSAKFAKKGYGLKLLNGTDLAGMGKAKRWVLTSNARDKSLIRNQIVYSMAEYVGLPWTPECVQVEVYLNHEYNGTYILQEKVEINEERIDIRDLEKATEALNDQELETFPTYGPRDVKRGYTKGFQILNDPEDITGGYLIEYENYQPRYDDEPCAYTTEKGKVIVVKEPEAASEKQMEYISAFIQGYENAIFAEDGVDPISGKHYSEFVDFNSLVLKYMLEEISKNCDGNKSSQYYFKPSDVESEVAFAGPAWDYDTTFGDYARERDSKGLIDPTGFYHNTISGTQFWWPQLYAKADFLDGIKDAWRDYYAPAMRILLGKETDENGALLSIKEYAAQVEQSAAMNFIRWPMKQSSENIAKTGKTYPANIDYLTDYIQKRYDFLNGEWTP